MKALLYKDFVSLWKYLKIYLLLCIGMQLASLLDTDNGFLRFYPTILVATIPNSLLAYDERDRWDKLCLTLPVSRRQLVTSKYLVGLVLLGSFTILSAVTELSGELGRGTFDPVSFGLVLGVNLLLGLFILCIELPATFRLGAERGRLIYAIGMGFSVVLFLVAIFALSALELPEPVLDWLLIALIVAFIVLLLPVSWRLSVRFYEKREF